MKKIAHLFLIFSLCYCSCTTVHIFNKPVYFIPDKETFIDGDSMELNLFYTNKKKLSIIESENILLKKGKTVATKLKIRKPLLITTNQSPLIVYPNERIIVKNNKYNDVSFEVNNIQKNNEVLLFRNLLQIGYSFVIPQITLPSIDTLNAIEKNINKFNERNSINSQRIFDSLKLKYHVSKTFSKLTKNFIENRDQSMFAVYSFYSNYKPDFKQYGLYEKKCISLLPIVNDITDYSKFNNAAIEVVDGVANGIIHIPLWKIYTYTDFKNAFEKIDSNFKNIPKDYLLSNLMYYAVIRKIDIGKEYKERYKSSCLNKNYKNFIFSLIKEEKSLNVKAKKISDNGNNVLIAATNNRVHLFEDVLKENKGELILIDFWATWCAPCIEDMAEMRKLMANYSPNDLILIRISFDKDYQWWKKFISNNSLDAKKNYAFHNSSENPFIKEYNLHTIPRYMLINKNGKIINDDTPHPGDPKLKELIDKYLNE